MAYEILHTIIYEAGQYESHSESKAALWDAYKAYDIEGKVRPFLDWLDETLDCLGVPSGAFRNGYVDGLIDDKDKMAFLMDDIRQQCEPDESDSESEKEDEKESDSE